MILTLDSSCCLSIGANARYWRSIGFFAAIGWLELYVCDMILRISKHILIERIKSMSWLVECVCELVPRFDSAYHHGLELRVSVHSCCSIKSASCGGVANKTIIDTTDKVREANRRIDVNSVSQTVGIQVNYILYLYIIN